MCTNDSIYRLTYFPSNGLVCRKHVARNRSPFHVSKQTGRKSVVDRFRNERAQLQRFLRDSGYGVLIKD